MTQRYDIKTIYEQALERLHDPYATGTGISTEAAGNAFLFIGDVFITYFTGHLSPGDGIGGTHGLAKMAITAFTAGEAAVCFTFHIGTALDIRQIMLCGQ